MNAGVVLEGVSKRYPGAARATLDALSLTVAAGEFVVLLGPSGCGKSTVLRLIAGLIAPSGGRIEIDGRDVTRASPKERNVAMVFQNYALFPHLSVYENMAFGLRIRGVAAARIDTAVRAAAEATGLSDLLQRKPKELSGGQSQRVALGRALVREPAVFLFDEPLSNLDPDLRGRMRAEIAGFRKRARGAMLYVTHDQLEAMTLADRIVVLDGGVVQQAGTPLDVYNAPAKRFVASFLGATPMNFMSEGALRALLADEPAGVSIRSLDAAGGTRLHYLAGGEARSDNAAVGPTRLQDAAVGLRPEDLYLADRVASGVAASSPFEATIDLLEALGDGAIVHCTAAGTPIVARLRHQFRAPENARVRLVLDLQRLHYFDDSGNRVSDATKR